MFGTPSHPSELSHRCLFYPHDAPPPWREGWERFDWQLDTLKQLGEDLCREDFSVLSMRSTDAKVAVLRRRSANTILWDETFFDYLQRFMTALADPSRENVWRTVQHYLLHHLAELFVLREPHRSLLFLDLSQGALLDEPIKGFRASDQTMADLHNMFRMVRNFALLHEIGHSAMEKPALYDRERRNLDAIRTVYGRIKDLPVRVFGPTPHADFIDLILTRSDNPKVEREVLADLFAVNILIEFDIQGLKQRGERSEETELYLCALAYNALALFYYVQASLNGVRRYFIDEKILVREDLGADDRVLSVTARGDLRLYLIAHHAFQLCSHDLERFGQFQRLLDDPRFRFAGTFRDTQLPPYEYLLTMDRGPIDRQLAQWSAQIPREEALAMAARRLGLADPGGGAGVKR
ncbi:MAG: hypothetical protein ACFB6R_05170 [Alphaproteobacteria bacterium]